jgi:hypothetical protein
MIQPFLARIEKKHGCVMETAKTGHFLAEENVTALIGTWIAVVGVKDGHNFSLATIFVKVLIHNAPVNVFPNINYSTATANVKIHYQLMNATECA